MEILVDCGGSGVKIAACAKGETGKVRRFKPKTLDEFCKCIKDVAKGGNPPTSQGEHNGNSNDTRTIQR